jgi:uridine kinase
VAAFDAVADRASRQPVRVAPADAVLLFDGVFLLRQGLEDAWELHVYLDVGDEELLRRALRRDLPLFGTTAAVGERYRQRYLPGQRRYRAAAQPRERADVLIDNADPSAPTIAKGSPVQIQT